MVLGLKLHLQTHQISSIPFTKLIRSPQSPLFQLQPIHTCGFSPLHLNSRRTNPRGFNASYLEGLINVNDGSGGGGGVEDVRKDGGGGGGGDGVGRDLLRLFLRGVELLLGSDREIVAVLGLPGKLAWLCEQVMLQLDLILMELGYAIMTCICVGFLVISGVVTLLCLHLL